MSQTYSYKKILLATCFGTFFEWYDFLAFGILAVTLGPLFFPDANGSHELLASLATFGAGMVMRPIGAALFGSLGDKVGRKPVFVATITTMGLTTICIGLLPTYTQAGIFSPILLVTLRLLQGLSAGGEIGGGSIYLVEHAGNKYRGFKTSFLQLMGPLGVLVSTLQIYFLKRQLSPEEFMEWGWRVPFLASFILLIIAIPIRKSLKETPVFTQLKKNDKDTKVHFLENFRNLDICKRMLLVFLCVSSSGSVLFFCSQIYTMIFLNASLKLDTTTVSQLGIFVTLTLAPLTIFSGWLSDKIGRKPVVIFGTIIGAASIYPVFLLLQGLSESYLKFHQNSTLAYIGLLLGILSVPLALVTGPQSALLAELFPTHSRSSAATFPHNLAAGCIGGLLPFAITWLNEIAGSHLIGLLYPIILLGTASIVGLIYLPETYQSDIY